MRSVLIVFLGTIFGWFTSLSMKKIIHIFKNIPLALVYQYLSIIWFSLLFNIVYSWKTGNTLIPVLWWWQRLVISLVSLAWYIAIYCLFQAFEQLHVGVVLTVANLSTFLMYFLNIYLIDINETLSFEKLILAFIFFVVISLFLLRGDWITNKIYYNKYLLYAVVTAVGRAIYFSGNTYFIRQQRLHPFQSFLITESLVGMFAWIWYRYKSKRSMSYPDVHLSRSSFLWLIVLWISLVAATACYYYWYQYLSSSLVNVIRLFNIIMSALLCRRVLDEHLTTREIFFMILACVVLVFFVVW